MNVPTLDAVILQAEQLSSDDKLLLAEKLIASVRAESPAPASETKKSRRIIGLFAGEGEMWMADDFDAPLDDTFWFGEDEGKE